MSSKSKIDALKAYYSSGPTGETSDYLEPTKKKKTKKKAKIANVSGMKIVDVDTETKVKEPERKDDSDEEDAPETIISPELRAEMERRERRKRLADEGEAGTWVDVDEHSPPRRSSRLDTRSNISDGDLSPPRRRGDDEDLSPPRRRLDSESPPRRRASDNDLSPPRRGRSDDTSPPRRRANDGDLSPPRRGRVTSNDDLSPPRRRLDSPSPPRHSRSTYEDLSPPRRRLDSPDQSPPRRPTSTGGDAKRGRPNDDLSPPRRPKTDSDLSPPRKRAKASPESASMGDHYANIPVHRRMLSGEVAGLRTGAEIAKELGEKKRREQESLRKQDPKIMGYGAETVYRDKHGRKLDMLNQLMNQQAGKLGTEEEAGMEWGKGKIDKEEKEKQEKELREAANAPYRGRTSDNQYMNSRLKQVDRWGDPMAGLISKEVVSTKEVEVIDEKGRKKTKHRKLWMGGYPPNRFDIRPGHRWDGKDRSNGFEKEYFQKKNATKIRQQEAYRWSAGDM